MALSSTSFKPKPASVIVESRMERLALRKDLLRLELFEKELHPKMRELISTLPDSQTKAEMKAMMTVYECLTAKEIEVLAEAEGRMIERNDKVDGKRITIHKADNVNIL